MSTQTVLSLANVPPVPLSSRVLLVVLRDTDRDALTELIARLALRGPFHLIPGSEWLPDQDRLKRSVRRYTTAVHDTLDHPIVGRPSTCLQMLEQLTSADSQPHPILVLDFLHYFYDPDVDLSLRQRTLERCCQSVQQLARSKPVVVLAQQVAVEEYQLFFPLVSSIADEILEIGEDPASPTSQLSFLGAG